MIRRGAFALLIVIAAVIGGAFGYRWWAKSEDDIQIAPFVEGFKRQNELTVFLAQVVSVPSSRVPGYIRALDRSQTNIYSARVRYTIDLATLSNRDVRWNPASKTLTVQIPPVQVQTPDLVLESRRVFRSGPPAAAATWDKFEASNVIKAKREAKALARNAELMKMARQSAKDAIAGNALLFLRGAGQNDVQVEVRFADEPVRDDGERLDRSRSLDEVYRAPATEAR